MASRTPVSLTPTIRRILSDPETDLTTISARRVRHRLLELDPSLDAQYVRDNKAELDTIIESVFATIRGDQDDEEPDSVNSDEQRRLTPPSVSASTSTKTSKRKRSSSITPSRDTSPVPAKQRSNKSKGKDGSMLTDEELARQLNAEINGRSTRGSRSSSTVAGRPKADGNGSKAKKGASRTPKKVRKSRAEIEDSDEEMDDADSDGEPKPKKKKTKSGGGGGGARGGFAKEFLLSEPLAALLQVNKLSRPQVVKQLWAHIKQQDLQNPDNKREILCDEAMQRIFKVDKIDMFAMNKVIGKHLHEPEE